MQVSEHRCSCGNVATCGWNEQLVCYECYEYLAYCGYELAGEPSSCAAVLVLIGVGMFGIVAMAVGAWM